MNKFFLTIVLLGATVTGVWSQEALGSSRDEILAQIGKPLDEIKDKATLKGTYESILVTTDPSEERPTAVLYWMNQGISVDYVVMSFYTPEFASSLPADKEAVDASVTGNGFEVQDIPGLPDGQALYYNADSKEFVFLADDRAVGKVKVLFLAYTDDNKTLGTLAQVLPAVIARVQKDLKL